jgi:mannitol/fructose-specific phosphotransferase system IIA component
MDILAKENVVLSALASTKEDAIRLAGEILVKGGYVAPEYIDGMLGREETMSTYIGGGVAIPHGQFENRESIYSAGLSVLQFPAGLEWGPDETAYLVIGIAATSDEHLTILANLAEVLEDEGAIAQLAQTTDPMVIVDLLTQEPEDA